jgi:hypothetical protein
LASTEIRARVAENFGARPDSITTSPSSCLVANGHPLVEVHQLRIGMLQHNLISRMPSFTVVCESHTYTEDACESRRASTAATHCRPERTAIVSAPLALRVRIPSGNRLMLVPKR